MYSRKVQEVGGGTYTVSLPREWAESQNISQGTVVDLFTHVGGQLTVELQERRTRQQSTTWKIEAESDEQLRGLVQAAYTAGIDNLRFSNCDRLNSEQRREIETTAQRLSGLAVETGSDTELALKMLLDCSEVSAKQIIRQLSFTALSMHEDAISFWTSDRTNTDLETQDDQADRLYAVLDRSFARSLLSLKHADSLGMDRADLFKYWVTARELERIADHAERLVSYPEEIRTQADILSAERIQDLSQTARDIVKTAVNSVIGDADQSVALPALEDRSRLHSEIDTLETKVIKREDDDSGTLVLLNSLRRTADHGGNIAHRCIQASFRESDTDNSLRSSVI